MPLSLPQDFEKQYESATGDSIAENQDKVEYGTYLALISMAETKEINDKSTVIPWFEIVSDIEGNETPEVGKRVSMKPFYFTDKAIFRFAGFLKMLNIIVSDRQVFNANVIKGRYASIEVVPDSYVGRDGNQYTKPIVGQVAPPADSEKNSEQRDGSTWDDNTDLPF